MKVSIVIPAHNEEKRIGKTLEEYSKYYNLLMKERELDYRIIVSINKTTDGTKKITEKFSKRDSRICYLDLPLGGKGYAVVEGFREALKDNSDLIGFVDADMATSPEEFHKLVKKLGKLDGVIASRWIRGAIVSPRPSVRRMIARWAFNSLIRTILFLPYRDTQCGAKVFKREVIESIVNQVTMSQWAFDVDLLYVCRKNGFKIREVPTVWTDKEYSKINFWKAGPRMALGVIRLRIINSGLKSWVKSFERLKNGKD